MIKNVVGKIIMAVQRMMTKMTIKVIMIITVTIELTKLMIIMIQN